MEQINQSNQKKMIKIRNKLISDRAKEQGRLHKLKNGNSLEWDYFLEINNALERNKLLNEYIDYENGLITFD
jgi:hypothetical protein